MIIGIAILLFGLLLLLEIINPGFAIDFSIVWPSFLIIITLYYIIKEKKIEVIKILLLFIGIWNLFVNLDLITGAYLDAFWPIILVIVGAFIIITAIDSKKIAESRKNSKNDKNRKKYIGILSGNEEKVQTDDFSGGDVYCIFGGIDLDLRQAELKEDAILNVYSIFGGGSILVSDNYKIVYNSTALFGGNDNKADTKPKNTAKTLTINCISVFGGTEIK